MKMVFVGAAALALIAAAGGAQAQDAAFNVGVVSDYVFRGFSQSNEDPAIQIGVDATSGGFYAGAWASTVDFGDDTDAEVDFYGGYRTEAAGFAVDVGAIAYVYPGANPGTDYDYIEVKAAASRGFGPVTIGAAAYWSPDFFGIDEEATYVEANFAVAPIGGFTVSGAYGQQSLDVNDDYAAWNLGVGYALPSGLGFDVRYHDADVDGPFSDERVVAAIKYSF